MRSSLILDDLRISYLHSGDGPATLLLHTIGGSANEWTRAIPMLDLHLTTFALDLPGHGESSRLNEHEPVPDIARLLVEFLDTLGIDRAHVVGSSLSGTNALELAIRFPDRVDRVVLVSGTGPWGDQPGLPPRTNLPTHTSENKEISWFRAQFHDPSVADQPGFFDWWVASRSRDDDEMIRAWRRRPLLDRPLAACLAPVLLLRGEHDPLHPLAWSQAWCDLLPRGEVATLGDARHFLNLEAPQEMAREFVRFLT